MPKAPPNKSGLPAHLAIIMDGNGRWAKAQGKERIEGHRAGARTVREIVTYCAELGVRYLTLYAFSSENWQRPPIEVSHLMTLLQDYLRDEEKTLVENEIAFDTIGDVKRLPKAAQLLIKAVKNRTQGLSRMQLTLALSYGSRDEIVRAVQDLAQAVEDGELAPEDIDADALSARLYTRDMPDPDLLIRTSGEYRISNFMLWQLAYSELYVTDVPWPEFTRAELDRALDDFKNRQRRFGKTGEQVQTGKAAEL
jgi:undecaprenyl diphosphate synthase